jgi:hypothetical protein
MGEWDQTRPKIRATFHSAKWRGHWAIFFDAMKDASFMSLGASRTGNQTLLRVRVSGKRHELRLETHILRGTKGREHVVGSLIQKFFFGEKSALIRDVESPGEFLWERSMGDAMMEPVMAEARERGIRFLDDIAAEVFSQAIGARQQAYQLEGAMGEFKQAVKAALGKGASFTDMEDILKEMAVLSVMES